MNPEPEAWLEQLTPRGASAEVRARVLARVGEELETASRLGRQHWWGLAVAASVALGLIFNLWISEAHQQRLSRLYGPPPIPAHVHAVATAVESVTDAPTAEWVQKRLAAAHRHEFSLPGHISAIEKFLRDLEEGRSS